MCLGHLSLQGKGARVQEKKKLLKEPKWWTSNTADFKDLRGKSGQHDEVRKTMLDEDHDLHYLNVLHDSFALVSLAGFFAPLKNVKYLIVGSIIH